MLETTLVIGDAHVEAIEDLKRFQALGNFIIEEQPDTIVQIGDFLSLDSLSAWDLNKRAKMEGRRFSEEIKSGKKAVDLLMSPLIEYNKNQAKLKKKKYSPRLISILGNHEDRWFRYLDTHPELIDVVDLYSACGFEKYGWEKVDYRNYAYVHGACFTHVPMDGTNNPIRGVRAIQTAAKDHETSVVYGHSHRIGIETNIRHGKDSQQVMAVNVGCFFEGMPEYANGSKASKDWWRGVIILEHYAYNKFDIKTYNLERLLREFL